MTTTRKDPLLMSAKVMTVIARVILVLGVIAVGIAMVAIVFASMGWLPDNVIEHITAEADSPIEFAKLWVALFPMAGALVIFALSYDFVKRLGEMIDTVGQGDPFTFANAARLTRMAWLALGIEAATFVATLLGDWVESHLGDESMDLTSEFSLTGILLALVLFILARVFREGARMRDELEGTV